MRNSRIIAASFPFPWQHVDKIHESIRNSSRARGVSLVLMCPRSRAVTEYRCTDVRLLCVDSV